jgi:hypothetical protein
MSYLEELERRNEKLSDMLADALTRFEESKRNLTQADLMKLIREHENDYRLGLVKAALILVDGLTGGWNDNKQRIEFHIQSAKETISGYDDILSLQIRKTDLSLWDRMCFRKSEEYVEIILDVAEPFGADGYVRVYNQQFIEDVRKKSLTYINKYVEKMQQPRKIALNNLTCKVLIDRDVDGFQYSIEEIDKTMYDRRIRDVMASVKVLT